MGRSAGFQGQSKYQHEAARGVRLSEKNQRGQQTRRGLAGKLLTEIRAVLDAGLRGDCPYNGPPNVEIISETSWKVNGVERSEMAPGQGYKVLCQYLITAPDQCADCHLNPANKPRPSNFLIQLMNIEAIQSAGAVFNYKDLTPVEWRGLLILKGERNRREIERMHQGRKQQ